MGIIFHLFFFVKTIKTLQDTNRTAKYWRCTHPGTVETLLLQNSHSLSVWLCGGAEPGGHPWCTQSVQNTERLISRGDSSGRFLSYLSLGLPGWLLSLGTPVGCYIKFDWQQGGRYWRARDLTRFPASSTSAWDELVIKFQRQLGYDPSVSTFFSCSVSDLSVLVPCLELSFIVRPLQHQSQVSEEKFIDFWDNWGCKTSDKWFIASDIDTSHLAQFRQKQIEVKFSNSGQMKDNFVPGRVGRPPLGYGRIFITFQLMARSFRLSQVIWTLISSLTSSVSLLPGSLIQSILSGGGDGIRSSRSHCGHVSAASLVTAPH